jgi:signal transduction histidine kinase
VGDTEEKLSSVVYSMANPVLVVDEAGRFVMLNAAAGELFRLSNVFEVGQPVAGKLGNPELEELLTGGDDTSADVAVEPPDAEPRVFRATVRNVRSSRGRVLGRLLALDDVTADRESEQLKADFVAVIGHELRTPLTIMKGYIHTLARRGSELDEEKRFRAHEALMTNVSRLERLIEDLLFVSAIERRRVRLDLEPCDLCALADTHAGERVSVRHPRRAVEANADRAKVDQVLRHLIDNALKYSEGPTAIEVAERADGMVEMAVSDSGPGIFSGDIPRVFDRFRQIDGTTTRAHGGVGIGLYLCKRLVEVMGGRIWCESRLGVGTRFAFSIPKDGPVEAAALPPKPGPEVATPVAPSSGSSGEEEAEVAPQPAPDHLALSRGSGADVD